MNRFERLFAGSTIAMSSFALSGAIVDAQGPSIVPPDQMSETDRDKAALAGKITCSIAHEVLEMYGPDVSYPEVVVEVQDALIDHGLIGGGIDGKLGPRTCEKILDFQDKNGKYVDGIVGKSTATALKLSPDVVVEPTSESKYDIDDCSRYDEWSESTIKQVQKALKVGVDGNFGKDTCNALIKYQIANGLAEFGQGALGYKTMSALGILFPEIKPAGSSSGAFNPAVDCPTSNSCEIFEDLTAQKGYVRVNDWNNNTATGETLFTYSIQSGKPGKESDTGLFRLGSVESGPNGNPWKLSTLGSSDGEPNLYKFRRLNPFSGKWWGTEGIHGSRSYGVGEGSSGCSRVTTKIADILARLKTNTLVLIRGMKPVR